MATENTPAPTTTDAEATAEEADRLPYVVVRMSRGMHDMLKAYCADQNPSISPTALGRTLLAKEIGWDLATDPDAPGGATRTRYATDEARANAKEVRRLHDQLLRKSLMQAHLASARNKPALVAAATQTIKALSEKDKAKFTPAEVQALAATLDEAIKAGR